MRSANRFTILSIIIARTCFHIFSWKIRFCVCVYACVCALHIYKCTYDSRRTVRYYKPRGVIVSKEPTWRRPCLGTSKCWQLSTGRSIDSAASHDQPFLIFLSIRGGTTKFHISGGVLSACKSKKPRPIGKRVPWRSVRRCRSRLDKLQFAGGSIVHHGKIWNWKLDAVLFFPPLFSFVCAWKSRARALSAIQFRKITVTKFADIDPFVSDVHHPSGLVARILMGFVKIHEDNRSGRN